ncbi:hypothetical protein Leryth_008233 [Lithospermum erythrorhizon]|nr:hypothetical protein Leryth_008233 [Lithospermum erythrorhizon]
MKAKTLIVRLQAPPPANQPPAATNQEPPRVPKTEAVDEQQQNAYTETIPLNTPIIDPLPPSDSLGKRKRKPKENHDEVSTFVIRSRKKKPATKSRQVLHNIGAKSLSTKQEDGAVEASNSRTPIKSPTLIRAEEVQSSLGNEYPTFLKSLVRSHVASCFWMGLPVPFCKQHLPRKDILVVIESENGEQFEVKYFAEKTGLSAGWRKFVAAHKLLEGDVLIFQLIAPITFKKTVLFRSYSTSTKAHSCESSMLEIYSSDANIGLPFLGYMYEPVDADFQVEPSKVVMVVYVIRANDLDEVDGALSLLNLDSLTKQLEAEGIASLNNKKKGPKSLPLGVDQKTQNKDGSSGSAIVAVGVKEDQSGNDSDEVASEVLEGTKFHRAVTRFRDMNSFEDFHIMLNGVSIDSEFPEQIRRKYYELCCNKKAFLHDHLLPGLSCKLAAGIIFGLVNTADAIRGCKITTPKKEFDIWDKSLKSFELLGMNVGFLRSRLRCLVSLAFDSEGAAETRRYFEVKTERTRREDEIRSLEEKLEGLKDASERYDADIEFMRPGAETYELMFQEEVNAPF